MILLFKQEYHSPVWVKQRMEKKVVENSLYEQLGGEAAIDVAVDNFYKKVIADERINHFFESTDMAKQHRAQKAFLTFALGGPNRYTGRTMRVAHTKAVQAGLNDSHFDAVVENLGTTLAELGVPIALIEQAAAIVETTRDDVLGR